MHFRTTAALIGIAAMACLYLGVTQSYHRITHLLLYVSSGVLLLFCFLYAKDNGYLICCYLLLVLLLAMLQCDHNKTWKKRFFSISAYSVIMIIVISSFMINGRALMNKWNGNEYAEYNKYRISYQDYGSASYEENEEIYRSLGWSENFFHLTKSLYYMDEKFNAENLSKIVQEFSWNSIDMEQQNASLEGTFLKLKNNSQNFFRTDIIPISLLCLYIGAIALLFYILVKTKYSARNLFIGLLTLACVLGTFLIYAYLCIKGRMILRAYQSFMLPAVFTLTLLALNIKRPSLSRIKKIQTFFGVLTTMCLWLTINAIYSPEDKNDYMQRQNVNYELENYTTKHKQNFYILNNQVGNSFYPFDVKDKGALLNVCHWGGGPMGTGVYREQMKEFGIKELSITSFFEDNVYLIVGYPAENGLYYLINYLNEEYQDLVTFDVVKDDNGLFTVLKAKTNETPENGWIHLGEYSYYMEDGKPKTGKFIVDGIEYYGEEETVGAQLTVDFNGSSFYIPRHGMVSIVES